MSRYFAITLALPVLLAGCLASPDPPSVSTEPRRANQFFQLKEPPAERAGDLPAGASLSDIRIGNDDCYYVVRGDGVVPLGAGGDPSRHLCLEV